MTAGDTRIVLAAAMIVTEMQRERPLRSDLSEPSSAKSVPAGRRFHRSGSGWRLRTLGSIALAPLGAASRLGDLRGGNRLLAFTLFLFEGHVDLR